MNKILQKAIEDTLTLFVQPIYDLKTMEIQVYEVLSRVSFNGVFVPPPLFLKRVPIEQHFFLANLVLSRIETILPLTNKSQKLSININPEDLESNEVVDKILKHKNKIIVEILENSQTYKKKISFLKEIREEGVSFALDDFGSEYSIYNYFTNCLNSDSIFDIIKLDRSITEKILSTSTHLENFNKLIYFIKSFDQKIVAEFISSKNIFDSVITTPIDYGQGYFLSEPFDSSLLNEPMFKSAKNNDQFSAEIIEVL